MLLTDMLSFMEKASNIHSDLMYIEEVSREHPDMYTTAEKLLIQDMSKKFFIVMNQGATTDSIDELNHLVGNYTELVDALFQIANEYEYVK